MARFGSIITSVAACLASTGLAHGQAIEVRIGSNPVLGSGTLFSALYDTNGNLTNVPAGAVGFNPAQPFSGTLRIGNSMLPGIFPSGFDPGLATVNINNTGVYPLPTYTGLGSPGLGIWTGVINILNGFATSGFINITLTANPGLGDSYTAAMQPGSATFSASGTNTWSLQGATFNGQFSGPTFGGVDVSPWFAGQGGGNRLFGAVINVGGNAAGVPDGLFSTTTTVTAIIPLPSAAASTLATCAGVGLMTSIRRRRFAAN